MWFLIIVGAFVDILIQYAIDTAGIPLTIPFVVATIVACWLIVNEMISILENLVDIGVKMPPFMMPLLKYINKQIENKAKVEKGDDVDE